MADRPRSARPHRYSLVAAAEVITARGVRAKQVPGDDRMLAWQVRSWEHYDTVGEYRFGVSWIANALSRVNLTCARPPEQIGDEPVAIRLPDETDSTTDVGDDADGPSPDERRAIELVQMIAGGAAGQGQLLGEFAEHLSIAGLGWLIAEPDLDDPTSDVYETWNVYAQDAVKFDKRGDTTTTLVRKASGNGGDAWRPAHPNALVVRCWRKHPRRWWEPNAPVRAVLDVLDMIDLLTAHIKATARSRLAGAGIFGIPSEAEFPPPPPTEGDDPTQVTEQDGFDYFTEQVEQAMLTPIENRDNAAAVVPLTVAIPGEHLDKMKHLTFSTPFDERVMPLLEQSVQRFALGMDIPPEVLTGMAGVNHWTAWQVEETAITLHVEPTAEIVCAALTEGWLRPALEAEGRDPDAAMVWYDTADLRSPPDKSGNAQAAYDRLRLSSSAFLRELGFSDEDAPTEDEFRQRVLLDAAKGAPTLAPQMLAAVGLLDPAAAAAAESGDESGESDASETPADADEPDGTPPVEDRPGAGLAAAGYDALMMACDGIIYRALERSGARLRSAIGRKVDGGPASIDVDDVTRLHLTYDPTTYADLDHLLSGAFDRVPSIAEQLGLDPDALTATLRAYCRSLLASQHEHDMLRLSAALGVDAFAHG